MSLRDVVLPMATDTRLRRLARKGGLRWDFKKGYAPLYLKGNWEQPERVKLVLLMAEPGRPDPNKSFSKNPDEWFRQAVLSPSQCKPFGTEHQGRVFRQRIEWFLGECGFDLGKSREVWSQIVISNTFWLRVAEWDSAAPKEAERYFIERYLGPILGCFRTAAIIGAGEMAKKRLKRTSGIKWTGMGALSPAGCNREHVRERQSQVAAGLRRKWGLVRPLIRGSAR